MATRKHPTMAHSGWETSLELHFSGRTMVFDLMSINAHERKYGTPWREGALPQGRFRIWV